MYSYIPKQAQVRIRFMSFYNVYTFLICHMGREMSFFMLSGLFRDPVMRYSVVSMPLLGKPDKVFFTFGGRKRKRGDTSEIVHSIGEKTVLHICSTPKWGGAAKMQR